MTRNAGRGTRAPRTPHAAPWVLLPALALLLGAGAVRAQSISTSGNPGLLRISSAIAGSEPTSVSDATRTYTVTTPNPGGNPKYQITAQLNANMPANVTLTANFAAPALSGTSNGAVTLDVTPRALVINMKKNFTGTAAITYALTATTAAGVIPNQSRTVTLTVTTYP